MKAIILAAGIGRRLNNINLPKCLLKVGDETLIERHIRILKSCGISDITIVIGSEGDCWTKNNVEKIYKYKSNIVKNKFNVTYNRIFSFYCGLSSIDESGLIIIDGDLVYDDSLIREIMNCRKPNLLLARYFESRFNNKLGGKIKLGRNDIIETVGYDFSSNLIYSGIFKTEKNIFNILVDISSKIENWEKGMSSFFNNLLEKLPLEAYLINTISKIPDLASKSDDYKPLINHFEIRDSIITKSSSANKDRLINEMNYLINISESLKPYFPEVLSHEIKEEKASYSMPYYSYTLFSDLIIKKKLSKYQILKLFKSILNFCFKKLYQTDRQQTPQYFLRQNYIHKFQDRLLKSKGKSKIFDFLIKEKHLTFNGKKMINATIILDKLINDSNLLAKLEPPFISIFHGDFRLGNILIDKSNNNFILIDPRGSTPGGMHCSDPIEDIAKLFATCKVNYDLIQLGEVSCVVNKKEVFEIQLSVNKEFEDIANKIKKIPDLIFPIIQNLINTEEDNFWEMRLQFMQALLLLALAPYKLISDNDENMCILLYSKGVSILNDFINSNPISNYNNENLVNINTQSDRIWAESIFLKD